MSRRVVEVSTGSRLHFGMLSFGQPGVRQFGGVGAMVDTPGVKLQISAADELAVSGPSAAVVRQYAEAVAQAEWVGRRPRCRIDVLSVVSPHVGLGSGTQLALAVAAGLNALYDRGVLTASELARSVARGRRSAVGLYGFLHGGLIAEAGKLADEDLSPLVARLPLPPEWRFLFVTAGGEGLSGEAERQAFSRVPPVPLELTARMASDVLLGLLPAAAEHRFEEFSEALFRFGREAGHSFASLQGGTYASRDVVRIVTRLRELGVVGVGQSSWGPTVFAVLPSQEAAESVLAQLPAAGMPLAALAVIARPRNEGAGLRVVEE
jgi:beta-RFAP synthase